MRFQDVVRDSHIATYECTNVHDVFGTLGLRFLSVEG